MRKLVINNDTIVSGFAIPDKMDEDATAELADSVSNFLASLAASIMVTGRADLTLTLGRGETMDMTVFGDREHHFPVEGILHDSSVRAFCKNIIRRSVELDPVDAIADIELALMVIKDKYRVMRENA